MMDARPIHVSAADFAAQIGAPADGSARPAAGTNPFLIGGAKMRKWSAL
jgi:hypothetical protein